MDPPYFPDLLTATRKLVAYDECTSIVLYLSVAMVPHLSQREDSIEHINAMCLHLFNLWCETRSVVPLTYLLRAWPLMNSDPETLRRLGTALRDLRRQHLHDSNDASFQESCELSDCVEELLAPSSPSTWVMSGW
ncbi:hypothetical protein OKW45_001127 [Paraburkholderia sp. WSM4175]|uniref:hypothetical protein n=1 Tax=Paraburkholderia sp. WSM4175 TaxID=2991072 RepID=UPI003D2449C1